MSIVLNGTTGITTPDITSSGALGVDASAPDNSLVVDSSGNVGINTSSPTSKLDVLGTASVSEASGAANAGGQLNFNALNDSAAESGGN